MRLYKHTEIAEYIYTDEEEKSKHKEEMEVQGYQDTGQIKINTSRIMCNPTHEYYGKYVKILGKGE